MKTRMHSRQAPQRGFSLIEIAIVLVIVGLALSAGLAAFTAQQNRARLSATQVKMEAIKTALINFVAKNRRLPCPAVASLAAGALGYGVEAANPGACTGTNIIAVAGSDANRRGIVPWATLGLADEAALDGYNRRFTYQVLLSQTRRDQIAPPMVSALGAGLRGNIQVYNAAPPAPPAVQLNEGSLAGAIIVSHGENGSGAWLPQSGAQMLPPLPTETDELENTDADRDFVQKDFSDSTANPFDDIVLALSPADILSALQQNKAARSFGQEQDETRAALEAIKAALAGFALQNRRLPFPDCIAPFDGREDTAGCTNIGGRFRGNVPWSTLGVPSQDIWGAAFRYSVSVSFTNGIYGQSITPQTIGMGAKAFTTTFALGLVNATPVRIQSRANPNNYMTGTVTSNVGTNLVVSVTATGGSGGPYSDWSISYDGRITVNCPAQTPGGPCTTPGAPSTTALTSNAPFVVYSLGRNGGNPSGAAGGAPVCTGAAPANPNPPAPGNCLGASELNNYRNNNASDFSPYVQAVINIPTPDTPVVTPPNGYDDMLIYGSTAELAAKVPN